MKTTFRQREDWKDFRSLEGLQRKAGVSADQIAPLLVKELVDNALDVSDACEFGPLPEGGFFVRDSGPGIDATDEEIAELFSIGRPLTSTKMLRLPTRGALGNGLRVVAGAVLVSEGSLSVSTRGRALHLRPQNDGGTHISAREPWQGQGTEVRVHLGADLPDEHPELFRWAKQAALLAGRGTVYDDKSSPWWYTGEAFWELLQSTKGRTVRQTLAELKGCSMSRAGTLAAGYANRSADSLDRREATALLATAQAQARPVQPLRLGSVGRLPGYSGYAKRADVFTQKRARDPVQARIPYVIEVWCRVADEPSVVVCVNRTPTTARFIVFRDQGKRTDYVFFGGNIAHSFKTSAVRDFEFLINIQTPYMPITTDGKAPELSPFRDDLLTALQQAATRASTAEAVGSGIGRRTKKAVILNGLPEAIRRAGGEQRMRYSLRQLFYALRPHYLDELQEEPSYGYFCQVITEYEAKRGSDLPGIYRDTRGVLYHPHTQEKMPLGTLTVEAYRRPPWTFNKILYCEKEGLFPVLLDAGWPERHDCALLTSKGYASRAARDVLDLLDQSSEPLTFFCIHDADGPGTKIFESLQEATLARGRREFRIVDFGLSVQEARRMRLDVEPVTPKKGRSVPVARDLSASDREWLQSHRVELNAMSTPQFLAWLEAKMRAYRRKVIPPRKVLQARLQDDVRDKLRTDIVERVLREAKAERQVVSAYGKLRPAIAKRSAGLRARIERSLKRTPTAHWREPVSQAAADLARRAKR